MKGENVKNIIIVVVLIALIVGYFYYLSNRKGKDTSEDNTQITAAEELLLRNYEVNYPPTPKEVVKQYLDFTKVIHNETLTDEEIRDVAVKLQELFDDELIANKSVDDYITDLKSEIVTFKNNNYSIVNMYTSASTDVVYFETDGYDCASLYGTFDIRTGSGTKVLRDIFILRMDDAGHWKIYGFAPYAEPEE